MQPQEKKVDLEAKKTREIKEIANLPGWQHVENYIDFLIEELLSLGGNIEKTDTPETIGFRYLAARTAAAYLEKVKNFVKIRNAQLKEEE